MSLTQTSFTVRENETLKVCARFTKYNISAECPMQVVININIAALSNTSGMYTYSTLGILTMLFVGTCMYVYLVVA